MHRTDASAVAARLRFAPQWRFHLLAPGAPVHLVPSLVYALFVTYMSMKSAMYRDEPLMRLEMFEFLLPYLAPFWLVDSSFDPAGAIRLFASPRHSLFAVYLPYLLSRLVVCALVPMGWIVLTIHRDMLHLETEDLLRYVVRGLNFGLVLGTMAMFWKILLRRTVVSAFAVILVVLSLHAARPHLPFVLRVVLNSLLFPRWIFGPSESDGLSEMLLLLQIITCIVFWSGLGYLAFRRHYR